MAKYYSKSNSSAPEAENTMADFIAYKSVIEEILSVTEGISCNRSFVERLSMMGFEEWVEFQRGGSSWR